MVTKRQSAKRRANKTRLGVKISAVPTDRAFFERLIAIGEAVPAEEWAKVPPDSAARFDEYLESMNP